MLLGKYKIDNLLINSHLKCADCLRELLLLYGLLLAPKRVSKLSTLPKLSLKRKLCFRLSFFSAFRQLSEAKQKTTRYAGERKKLYKKITEPSTIRVVQAYCNKGKVILMAKQANNLSHTKWMCKYHIVIVPKYRRKIIYN